MTSSVLRKANLITVGETWGATTEKAMKYSNPDQSEFSMIFNFEHSLLDQIEGKEKWDLKPLNLVDLKQVFKEQQVGLYEKGWNSLFWNNHDLPRIVSRWGDDKTYRVESANMLAALLHFMQGTPYIYQGEELGMTNNIFKNVEDYRDIETLNMIKDRLSKKFTMEDITNSINVKGRDNARTPFHWNRQKYAGFSENLPWIEVNQNYKEINVETQKGDPESVLEFYRKLISLRKNSNYEEVIEKGQFEMIEENHPSLFAYKRRYKYQTLLVLCNFYEDAIHFNKALSYDGIVINNYPVDSKITKLRSYETIVLDISKHNPYDLEIIKNKEES
jgi:glycosidase